MQILHYGLPNWRDLAGEHRSADDLVRLTRLVYPPVDVGVLANSMGVRVHYFFDDRDYSGALEVADGEPEILVNGREPPSRQRFTVGHELGHLFLHGGASGEVVRYRDATFEDKTPEETQANRFAATLLMPADMVRAALRVVSLDIPRLARQFQVSQGAMVYRLKNLGLLP